MRIFVGAVLATALLGSASLAYAADATGKPHLFQRHPSPVSRKHHGQRGSTALGCIHLQDQRDRSDPADGAAGPGEAALDAT